MVTENEVGYEQIEVRLPAAVTAFIESLAVDAGVSRDEAASVLTALALRRYLTPPPTETARREG